MINSEQDFVMIDTPDSSQVQFNVGPSTNKKVDEFLDKLKQKNLNLKLNYKKVADVAKNT